MNTVRVIPRLDIKGPNLVKGIHFEGLRVLGKPDKFAKFYYEHGADELFFQDTVASLYERNSLHDIISKTAKEIFIPLTVGGGIRSIDDIQSVLRAGADKVAINTAAVRNPQFIKDASRKFGSSTIVVAIEAIKNTDNKYYVFTDNGREETGLEVISWAKKAEELGAGEIVISSVDKEGTGEGFDFELVKNISEAVSIPVIAHGGAKSPRDIANVITHANIDAVAVASILHYGLIGLEGFEEDNDYQIEGNISFLSKKKAPKHILPTSIAEIKNELINNQILTRH